MVGGREPAAQPTVYHHRFGGSIVANDRQDRHSQLIQAAKDAAFEAAEAMDRRDLKTWNDLQDRAAELRKEARRLKSGGARKQGKKAR